MDTGREVLQLLISHHVHNRMVLLRYNSLHHHHLYPTGLTKQLGGNFEDSSSLLEQFNSMSQGVRYLHITTIAPKLRIVPISDVIVQHNKISSVRHLVQHLAIELFYIWLPNPIVREHLN